MIGSILFGLGPDFALLIIRLTVGVFFAISGFHKLFNSERHSKLFRTLVNDRIPFPQFNVWWVPAWEFVAGVLLATGLVTVFAAGVLMVICLVACHAEAGEKIKKWEPHINCADKLDCYLYLPEVLYVMMLLAILASGPGMYSIDWLVFH